MNKKLIAAAVLILVAAFYFFQNKKNSSSVVPDLVDQKAHKEMEEPPRPQALSSRTPEEVKKAKDENKKKIEEIENDQTIPVFKKSLAKMSHILTAPITEDLSHTDFIEMLKENNLEPIVRDRTDPDLGRIIHVRTKNNLPGTRYLQARFQNTPDGQTVAVYATYDVKPGSKNLQESIDQAKAWAGVEGKPDVVKDDFIMYKLPDHRIMWAKRMNAEDLKNHPFNAYDPKTDVGTIQVMIEPDIHSGTTDDHQHDAENFHVEPEPEEERE